LFYRVLGGRGKDPGADQREAVRVSAFVGLGFFIIEGFVLSWFYSYIISDLKLFTLCCPAVAARGAGHSHLGAPASRAALEQMAVMQNAIEHRGNCGHISQQSLLQSSTGRLEVSSVLARS